MKTKWKQRILTWALILTLILGGCSLESTRSDQTASNPQPEIQVVVQDTAAVSDSDPSALDSMEDRIRIRLGEVVEHNGDGIAVSMSGAGTQVTITEGGVYELTGKMSGQIVVRTEEAVQLILNGVDIVSADGPAIYIAQSKHTSVTAADGTKNNLTDSTTYSDESAEAVLFSHIGLTLDGYGTLVVDGNYKHAIASETELTVLQGTLEIRAVRDGLAGKETVLIEDGSIQIYKSNEGIESKGSLIINGGTIEFQADDDGLNAGTEIVINGGTVQGLAGGDGIDSNGIILMNGGDVTIFAADSANGPIDVGDEGGSITINGGNLFVSGGAMAAAVNSNSTQPSIWIGANSGVGDVVTILSDGREIGSYEVGQAASLLFYSSEELSIGNRYVVRQNDSVLGEITLNNASSSIGGSGMNPMMGPNMGGPARPEQVPPEQARP